MPLIDLDTIFGEIAAFLTFDLNNFFNIRAENKKPQFLPHLWDGRVEPPTEQVPNDGPQEQPAEVPAAEEEEITKPSKKCSVTAKIKREEYKRIHKIRKCGYERKSEVLRSVSSVYCNSMRNSEPSIFHDKSCNTSPTCHRSVSSVCSVLVTKMQAQNDRKQRQDSIVQAIRQCIVNQQNKQGMGDLQKCGNRLREAKNPLGNPTAYYENLQREDSDVVVHSIMPRQRISVRRNFFENLQDQFRGRGNQTQRNVIELAECGVQVRPHIEDKLVGTDEWILVCKKSEEQNAASPEQQHPLNVGADSDNDSDDDMPPPNRAVAAKAARKREQQCQRKRKEQRQMKQQRMKRHQQEQMKHQQLPQPSPSPSSITAYLKKCLSEERKLPMSVEDDSEFLQSADDALFLQPADDAESAKRQRAIKRAKVCDNIKKNINKREAEDAEQPNAKGKRGLIGTGCGRFINPTPSCCPWQPKLRKQPSLEPPKGQAQQRPPEQNPQFPHHSQQPHRPPQQQRPQHPQRPQQTKRPQHHQQPQRPQQQQRQQKQRCEQKQPPQHTKNHHSELSRINLEMLDQQQYEVQQLLLHQQHEYHRQLQQQERQRQEQLEQQQQQQQQLQDHQRQQQQHQQQHQQYQEQPHQQQHQQCHHQRQNSCTQPAFLRNAAIANRMIAMINKKIEENDVNQSRDIIETRARYLWQLLQSRAQETQNANGDWAQLKPHEKLAFSWAIIANQTVFDNPLDNFMDFYLKECTANGKQSLSTELIDRGLAMWQAMDKTERLPFVMEAFIYLVSRGQVDINNSADVGCAFRGLESL